MAKRSRDESPPFAEEGLDALQFHLRGGLAKFVPADDGPGGPGFAADGGREVEGEPRFLLVRLRIEWAPSLNGWYSILGIYDRDDLCSQRWRPLTWALWRDQLSLYESLTKISAADMSYLREEGFD